jgi:hypothetical protein
MFDDLLRKVENMRKQVEEGGWRPSPFLLLWLSEQGNWVLTTTT